LRAGPLSSSKVIKLLNTHFVNGWVLLRELPELEAGTKGGAAAALAKELQAHFVYPVDSLILTPESKFIQHLPTNEFFKSFPSNKRKPEYLKWLKSSLMVSDFQLRERP